MARRRADVVRTVAAVLALLCVAPATARAEVDAELAYRTYCTPCHGLAGNGKGINVPFMSVQPRDHTDTREMGTRSDQDLFNAITGGGPAVGKSALMPPWRAVLSDDRSVAPSFKFNRLVPNA